MRGVKCRGRPQQDSPPLAAGAFQLPLDPSSSGQRNMKQASPRAFLALDLGQTLGGSGGGASPSPFVADAAIKARTASSRVGNKSGSRGSNDALAPLAASQYTCNPVDSSDQLLDSAETLNHTNQLSSRRRSESPFIRLSVADGKSFESQPSNRRNLLQQPLILDCKTITKSSHDNDEFDQLNYQSSSALEQQQQPRHKERAETMSQTIQSIQSLSIQLNRAASLSASLDTMSGSQEISSGPAANAANSSKRSGKRLTKLVNKKAGRVKEILLQNLGKAHKTTDDLFAMYEENFYKQQAQAVKIQKEFKSYMSSLKGSQESAKSLNVCIQQSTAAYQSARHDLVCENLSQLDILNEDLLDKLRGQIQASLSEYISQFSEVREKILKRKRKLIDYDSSRRVYELMLANVQRKRQMMQQQQSRGQQSHHNQGFRSLRPSFMARSSSESSTGSPVSSAEGGESIQSAASQLVDEARLLKLREQFNYCKIMFEAINSELYQELPMVYEKKMRHLLVTLQNYFSLEAQFHSNAGKLFATASDVIDELPMSIHRLQQQNPLNQQQQINKDDEYITHKASGSSGVGSSRGDSSLESSSSPDNSVNGSSSPNGVDCCATFPVDSAGDKEISEQQQQVQETKVEDIIEGNETKEIPPPSSPSVSTIDETIDGVDTSCRLDSLSMDFEDSSGPESVDISQLEAIKQQQEQIEDDGEQTSASEESSCSVIEVKPEMDKPVSREEAGTYLYKVKTCYKYLAEDVDELCFEADEIIQVIEFDENQEKEEGWLMGVREVNGQKGLFPANFTKPITVPV